MLKLFYPVVGFWNLLGSLLLITCAYEHGTSGPGIYVCIALWVVLLARTVAVQMLRALAA